MQEATCNVPGEAVNSFMVKLLPLIPCELLLKAGDHIGTIYILVHALIQPGKYFKRE
jgi:hypothetical protein